MKSNIITSFICAAIAALAFGCGGAPEEDNASDLGQAEQELSVAGPTYGISTASSKTSCNQTNSSQVCTVPLHNTIKYCYGNGITSTEITRYQAVISNLVGQQLGGAHFTMTRVFAGSAANCEAASVVNAELKIKAGTCSGGSTSTSIDAYVCLGVGNTAVLTESVPGSWSSHSSGQITVDEADLAAHGAADGASLSEHGIYHNVLAYWGVGANDTACVGGTGTGNSFCATQRFINPIRYECSPGVFCTQHTLMSATQKCEVNNYVVTSPTTWGYSGFTCP